MICLYVVMVLPKVWWLWIKKLSSKQYWKFLSGKCTGLTNCSRIAWTGYGVFAGDRVEVLKIEYLQSIWGYNSAYNMCNHSAHWVQQETINSVALLFALWTQCVYRGVLSTWTWWLATLGVWSLSAHWVHHSTGHVITFLWEKNPSDHIIGKSWYGRKNMNFEVRQPRVKILINKIAQISCVLLLTLHNYIAKCPWV